MSEILVSPSPRGSCSGEIDDLRRRAHDVLAHDLIDSPAAPLHQLGLLLRRRLEQLELALRVSSPSALPELAGFVRGAHAAVDHAAGQIALCESTARHCLAAREVAQQLVAQERVHFQDLRRLFTRLLDEVRGATQLSRIFPTAGLNLAACVASRTSSSEPAIFVEGITAARILLWALQDDERSAGRLPEFATAAIFQDVGRLLAFSRTAAAKKFHEKRTTWLEKQHPAIGAALLGAVRSAPVELALMVSQHHERLDGLGYPRGLTSREALPSSRNLALCTRLAELSLTAEGAAAGDESPPARVIRTVVAEAEWGMWPVDFARRLAARIAATEHADLQFIEHGSPVHSSPASERELPRDDVASRQGPAPDHHLRLHEGGPPAQGMHAGAEGLRGALYSREDRVFSPVELDSLRRSLRR